MKRAAIISTVLACFGASSLAAEPPVVLTPPAAKTYIHQASRMTQGGADGGEFWLYEPADPAPKAAPSVVIFMHGWAAIDPWVYSAWIDHLVRQGNVVIYPRYQANVLTSPSKFLPNTIKAVKAALAMTQTEGHVKPNLEQVAIVGHSAGGLLSALLAASSKESGLPAPKAVCCVQPGKSTKRGRGLGLPLDTLGRIPSDVLLLCVVGDRDTLCSDTDAQTILQQTPQIPLPRKNLMVQVTNEYVSPHLIASHYAPCSVLPEPMLDDTVKVPSETAALAGAMSGDFSAARALLRTEKGQKWLRRISSEGSFTESLATPDSMDYTLWYLFDALRHAAFTGKDLDGAMGRTKASRQLGKWQDGVKPSAP